MKKYTLMAMTLVLTVALLAGCGCTNRANPTTRPTTMPTQTTTETTNATTATTNAATTPTADTGNGGLMGTDPMVDGTGDADGTVGTTAETNGQTRSAAPRSGMGKTR